MLRLPTDKLIQILGTRNAAFSNGGHHREVGRIALDVEANLFRLKGNALGPQAAVYLTDLSVHGVGLIHDQKMFRREHFMLQVVREGATVLYVQCVVTRCARTRDDKYHIGAEYVRVVDEQSLSISHA